MSIMTPDEAREFIAEARARASVLDEQRKAIQAEYRAVVEASTEAREIILDSGQYDAEEFMQWATGGKAHDMLRAECKAPSPYIYNPLLFDGSPAYGESYRNDDGTEAYMLHPSLGFHVMLYKDMTDAACDDLAAAIIALVARLQPSPNYHLADGSVGWLIDLFDHDHNETRSPMVLLRADGTAMAFDESFLRRDIIEFDTLAEALRHERRDHYYEQSDRRAKGNG